MATTGRSTEQVPEPESFDEFRNSFSHGPRTDLSFKFMKTGTEQQADEFLQELLASTGNLIDDDDT